MLDNQGRVVIAEGLPYRLPIYVKGELLPAGYRGQNVCRLADCTDTNNIQMRKLKMEDRMKAIWLFTGDDGQSHFQDLNLFPGEAKGLPGLPPTGLPSNSLPKA